MKRYIPIQGGDLDFDVAVIQSAQCLDIAAAYATEVRDIEALLLVTEGWLKIAGGLQSGVEQEESNTEYIPIGFAAGGVGEYVEPREADELGDDEPEDHYRGRAGVRSSFRRRSTTGKSGKLAGKGRTRLRGFK